MTSEQTKISRANHKKAVEHFGTKGTTLVLHHVDVDMIKNDIERYIQWNADDLIVLTREEHASLHHKGTKRIPCPEDRKRKISDKLIGRKLPREVADNIGRGHQKKVMCIETGEIFESVKSVGCYYALKTGGTSHGYHWKYY